MAKKSVKLRTDNVLEEFYKHVLNGTLEDLHIPHSDVFYVREAVQNHVFQYDSVDLQITVSMGVICWNGDDEMEEAEALVEAADKHLYAAKEGGRNRVVHDPLPGADAED